MFDWTLLAIGVIGVSIAALRRDWDSFWWALAFLFARIEILLITGRG